MGLLFVKHVHTRYSKRYQSKTYTWHLRKNQFGQNYNFFQFSFDPVPLFDWFDWMAHSWFYKTNRNLIKFDW